MAKSFDIAGVIDRMPTPSPLAVEVLRLCEDEHAGIDDLAGVIRRDPALTVRVLNLANSAHYSRGREVTSIERASLVLGFRAMKVAALGFVLTDRLPRRGVHGGLPLELFWARSLTQATAARTFAGLAGSSRREEAHLAGLVADIGRIGLAIALPEEYEGVVAAHGPWPSPATEQAEIGMSSADFGSLLLGTWRMPSLFVWAPLVAEGYAVTSTEGAEVQELAPLVHLGRVVTEVLLGEGNPPIARLYDQAYRSMRFDRDQVDGQLRLLQQELALDSAQLSIELPAGLDVLSLLDRARRAGLAIAREALRPDELGSDPRSGCSSGS